MQVYLISYDIQKNKMRRKVVKLLKQNGFYRVQKSVFIGYCPEVNIKEIKKRMGEYVIRHPGDSYLIVPVHRAVMDGIELFGEEMGEPLEVVLGKVKILFF